MCVGVITELWRYPVSSVGGEQLNAMELEGAAAPFDRRWALVDSDSTKPASPENDARWRPALFLRSRLTSGDVEIGFPDGEWLEGNDPYLRDRLFRHFGFAVELASYGTAAGKGVVEIRYQPSPVHVVTTASLEYLASIAATNDVASRRFRPTMVIRTEKQDGFVEHGWLGRTIMIGTATLEASEETKRCGMTLIAQPGLDENPEILRSVVRHNRRFLGIYCTVAQPGHISVGDEVILQP